MGDTGRPMRGGRQAEADRNDSLVLTAAREIFTEFGWDAPISAVAQRAGVGMGSIYRRYPSKQDLLREMCVGAMGRAAQEAARALAEEPTGWAALCRFMRCMVEARSCALFVLAGSHLDISGPIGEALDRLRLAIDDLVHAARAEHALRDDVTSADIYLLLCQLRHSPVADNHDARLQRRYLEIVLAGLADPARSTAPTDAVLPGPAPAWSALR